MSIRRSAVAVDHFTIVPNDWLRDRRLSRRARGLLAELMSHQVGWEITIESLVEAGPEGRHAIRMALAELEAAGYLQRVQGRAETGHWGGTDYIITDPPQPENPHQPDPSPQISDEAPAENAQPPSEAPAPQAPKAPKRENPHLADASAQVSDVTRGDPSPSSENLTSGGRPQRKNIPTEDQRTTSLRAQRAAEPRAHRIPDDWAPSEEDLGYARQRGITHRGQLADTIDNFRDYWRNRTGSNARKIDWSLAFRTWVRKETPAGGGRSRGGGGADVTSTGRQIPAAWR